MTTRTLYDDGPRTLVARSLRSWLSRDATIEGPRWLLWLWTLLLCLAIAFGFTLLGMAVNAGRGGHAWAVPRVWARYMGINLVVTLPIGVIAHLLFDLLISWIGPERVRHFSQRQRTVFFTAVPLVAVVVGWPLGLWLAGRSWGGPTTVAEILSSFAIALLISFFIFLIFGAKARQIEAEKRALEAQLRLLQGQMEPHFLFNTLANVLTLVEDEPARARRMLESFTDYLRATLTHLRSARSSVGHELALAEAYLQLLQLRMEDRLTYTIDADDDSRQAALPPLLLQPLVENAIQHGLEPQVDGGRLQVEVRRLGDRLQLTVTDDGLGARPQDGRQGHGIALANIRQRLHALYGDDASLTIEPLQHGTRAVLRLPADMSDPSPAHPNA